MRAKRLLPLLAALALAGGALPSRADDLLDAYRQARAGDPALRQAEAQRDIVRENVAQARAPLLPQAVAGFALSQTRGGANADLNAIGRSRNRLPSITVSQTVLDLRRLATLQATRAQADSQDAVYRAALQALPVRVATAYFGVLVAADELANVQSNEDAFQQQVKEARARYDAGLSALVDLDQARAYAASAQADTITARKALDDAREALTQITGAPVGTLKTLREDILSLPPEPADAQAWIVTALQNNPLLQAQRENVNAAERNIASARAGHLPTVSAGFDVSRPATWPDDGSGQTGRTVTTIGLTMTLPLTDGGATQSLVRQALRQRDAAQDNVELQRRSVVRDVQAQYRSVLAGIDQIAVTREAASAAEKALAATRVGQQTGTHTMTDLLLAIQLLASAQSAYSQARHQFVLDKLLLQQAAGSVDEGDLQAINGQLQ